MSRAGYGIDFIEPLHAARLSRLRPPRPGCTGAPSQGTEPLAPVSTWTGAPASGKALPRNEAVQRELVRWEGYPGDPLTENSNPAALDLLPLTETPTRDALPDGQAARLSF
jgi:hypothetical protein